MPDIQHAIARAQGTTGATDYQVAIHAGRHDITADEPPIRGGTDAGPAPYDLVLSGLVACTAITLRMYAQRKGWSLVGVRVEATLVKRGDTSHVDRRLWLQGDLTLDQEAGLLAIAERTPVTLTLKNGLEMRTELQSNGDSMWP